MAATVLAVTAASGRKVVRSLAAVDAANGNIFANNGNTYLWVNNGSGGGLNITFTQAGQTLDGVSTAGKVIALTNGQEAVLGPFPQNVYNDSTGSVTVNWSTGSSVTVLAFSM